MDNRNALGDMFEKTQDSFSLKTMLIEENIR